MLRAYSRDDRRRDQRAAARSSTFIPALAYTFAQQPDRGRGRARGARRRRVEVLAVQADPPQLRPHDRLLAGAAAAVLAVRHAASSVVSLGVYVVVIVQRIARRRAATALLALWDRDILAFFLIGMRAVRPRPARRVRRPHLPAGARAAALHRCRRSSKRARRAAAGVPRRPAHDQAGRDDVAPSSSPTTTSACAACRVLLAHGVDVPLVVTHDDNPGETIWFDSVAAARRASTASPVVTPDDPNAADVRRARARRSRPTSCSRSTTGSMLTAAAARHRRARGALNMHGSLLPQVPRPRAGQLGGAPRRDARPARRCTRWSRSPTPATSSTRRPCRSCPTTPRGEVFGKVTVAAETGARPRAAGARSPAPRRCTPQDLARGSYFGGRKPEDGRIDWSQRRRARSTTWSAPSRRPTPAPSRRSRGARLRVLRTPCSQRGAHGARRRPALSLRDGRRCARLRRRRRAARCSTLELDGAPADAETASPRASATRAALPQLAQHCT